MPRRNSTIPIPSFPADIDRDYFGAWFSGFVDGEGCFTLQRITQHFKGRKLITPRASLGINLRADDHKILEHVRSYFGCGYLTYCENVGNNGNPQWRYAVFNTTALATLFVPHFERWPLLAKKSRDFAIWKQGVAMLYKFRNIDGEQRPKHAGKYVRIWTPDRLAVFESYRTALKKIRQYTSNFVEPELIKTVERPLPLFPDLPRSDGPIPNSRKNAGGDAGAG